MILLACDLASKKWMTNELNFFLNTGQREYMLEGQKNWALADSQIFLRGDQGSALGDGYGGGAGSGAGLANGVGAGAARNPVPGANQVDVMGEDGKWVKFRLLFNDRFIFGLGPNTPVLGFLLTAFATVGLFFIRLYYYQNTSPIAWVLIFSGAVGNLIDKMFLKSLVTREWTLGLIPEPGSVQGVVDFIEVIWFGVTKWQGTFGLGVFSMQTWPSFNLADSFIVIGVIWLLIRFK